MSMFKLEARSQPSDFWRIASPLLALVLTVVLGVILFLMLGKTRSRAWLCFFGNLSAAATLWASWW